MKQYRIKNAFQLQSHPNKVLLQPGQFYATEIEKEISELSKFAERGSCEEVVAEQKDADADTGDQTDSTSTEGNENPNPEEDITVVPGIGNTMKQKLEEAGVTTVSALKEAITTRADEMNVLLGNSFEKVQEYFAE